MSLQLGTEMHREKYMGEKVFLKDGRGMADKAHLHAGLVLCRSEECHCVIVLITDLLLFKAGGE